MNLKKNLQQMKLRDLEDSIILWVLGHDEYNITELMNLISKESYSKKKGCLRLMFKEYAMRTDKGNRNHNFWDFHDRFRTRLNRLVKDKEIIVATNLKNRTEKLVSKR